MPRPCTSCIKHQCAYAVLLNCGSCRARTKAGKRAARSCVAGCSATEVMCGQLCMSRRTLSLSSNAWPGCTAVNAVTVCAPGPSASSSLTRAQMADESSPPLCSNATGTSLRIRKRTASFSKRCICWAACASLSASMLSELALELPCASVHHCRMCHWPFCSTPLCAGGNSKTPSKKVSPSLLREP